MLEDYLEKKNISIYKLAQMSNLPYTTVNELVNGKKKLEDCKYKTLEAIATALDLPINSLIRIASGKKMILSTSWEDMKKYTFSFPIIVNNDNYEVKRIHPLMQKPVNDIYQIIKNDNRIKKVILFGSSVNIRCGIHSDIDLAIELNESDFNRDSQNEISEAIQIITEYNCDIVWLNTIDKNTQLYNNILSGVTIYEKNINKNKNANEKNQVH